MHFYNILTVGQFSRKLSHLIINKIGVDIGSFYIAHEVYCKTFEIRDVRISTTDSES